LIFFEEQKNKLKIHYVGGYEDYLYKGNSQLHIFMRDIKVLDEYRVVDGGHIAYFRQYCSYTKAEK